MPVQDLWQIEVCDLSESYKVGLLRWQSMLGLQGESKDLVWVRVFRLSQGIPSYGATQREREPASPGPVVNRRV